MTEERKDLLERVAIGVVGTTVVILAFTAVVVVIVESWRHVFQVCGC